MTMSAPIPIPTQRSASAHSASMTNMTHKSFSPPFISSIPASYSPFSSLQSHKPLPAPPARRTVQINLGKNTVRTLPRNTNKTWRSLSCQLQEKNITDSTSKAYGRYWIEEQKGKPVLVVDTPAQEEGKEPPTSSKTSTSKVGKKNDSSGITVTIPISVPIKRDSGVSLPSNSPSNDIDDILMISSSPTSKSPKFLRVEQKAKKPLKGILKKRKLNEFGVVIDSVVKMTDENCDSLFEVVRAANTKVDEMDDMFGAFGNFEMDDVDRDADTDTEIGDEENETEDEDSTDTEVEEDTDEDEDFDSIPGEIKLPVPSTSPVTSASSEVVLIRSGPLSTNTSAPSFHIITPGENRPTPSSSSENLIFKPSKWRLIKQSLRRKRK
ncbi:hypothetical protein BKA69DRAFT_910001 [Paraphysoderma sedebokerense]|nr:hypothetical protein BKA69DRAFT_910001 [Paraphysoderma sedebokerense]